MTTLAIDSPHDILTTHLRTSLPLGPFWRWCEGTREWVRPMRTEEKRAFAQKVRPWLRAADRRLRQAELKAHQRPRVAVPLRPGTARSRRFARQRRTACVVRSAAKSGGGGDDDGGGEPPPEPTAAPQQQHPLNPPCVVLASGSPNKPTDLTTVQVSGLIDFEKLLAESWANALVREVA